MASDTSNPLREFDRLAAHESVRLLRALSEEEVGLSTAARSGVNAHCASRDHAHKQGSNSESLAVRPAKKFTVKRGNDNLPGGKFVECYGCCQFKGAISEYLLKVGPEGAAERFWSADRVSKVVTALETNSPLSLGWLDWKRDQGLGGAGFVAKDSTMAPITQASGQSIQRFKRELRAFESTPIDSDIAAEVAAARGWKPEIVMEVAKQGLMKCARSSDYPDDIKISFAYRGLFRSEGSPVRLIKTRLLRRGVSDAPMSRSTVLNPGADAAPVCDFSDPKVQLQSVPTLALVEGEPDAISWRSMRPSDGVMCIGNTGAYSRILDVLPMLNMDRRRVVYCLDADRDANGFWKKRNPAEDFQVMRALQDAGASVFLWCCPRPNKEGLEAKDVNDFLKLSQGRRDPVDYAKRVNPHDLQALTRVCEEIGLPLRPEIEKEIGGFFRELRDGKDAGRGVAQVKTRAR